MHLRPKFFFRALGLCAAFAVSALALPGFAVEPARIAGGTIDESCATASSTSAASSSSSVASGNNRSHTSTASTEHGRHDQKNRECGQPDCAPSSSITAGPDGVSGLTKMPDGSSVAVQSGSGVSGSSKVTTGSSSSGDQSPAGAPADRVRDCVSRSGPR
jgi:hypothetical protein